LSGTKRRLLTALLAGLSVCLGSFASAPQAAFAAAPAPNLATSIQRPAQYLRAGHPTGMIPRRDHKPAQPNGPSRALPNNPNCPGCTPPLLFDPRSVNPPVAGGLSGTPGHVTITPLYTASYKAIVNAYVANVAAASQHATNVYSAATQYYQQLTLQPIQRIQYVITAGAAFDITAAFPAQQSAGNAGGCDVTGGLGLTACVADAQLEGQLNTSVSALSLPIDDSHIYMVMFPNHVETCQGPGNDSIVACSVSTYCAYHSGVFTTNYLLYANEPFPDLNGCTGFEGPQAPNGDQEADAVLSSFSHEASETITDWAGAWYDSARNENGDECAYVYGLAVGGSTLTGTGYNQVINGGHYYTQDEFSNEDFALLQGDVVSESNLTPVPGCVQREELPTATFAVPSNVTVGNGKGFNGSASSDQDNGGGPLTYTWSWGDGTGNSPGATPSHTFTSASTFNVTLSVTDVNDGWTGSVTHPVPVLVAGVRAPIDQGGGGNPGARGGGTVASGNPPPRAPVTQGTPINPAAGSAPLSVAGAPSASAGVAPPSASAPDPDTTSPGRGSSAQIVAGRPAASSPLRAGHAGVPASRHQPGSWARAMLAALATAVGRLLTVA
jgi:PKD repeat protein